MYSYIIVLRDCCKKLSNYRQKNVQKISIKSQQQKIHLKNPSHKKVCSKSTQNLSIFYTFLIQIISSNWNFAPGPDQEILLFLPHRKIITSKKRKKNSSQKKFEKKFFSLQWLNFIARFWTRPFFPLLLLSKLPSTAELAAKKTKTSFRRRKKKRKRLAEKKGR